MPYGTCQGDYHCDSCSCSMPSETLAWVDLKKRKLYCMACKPEEALEEGKPSMDPLHKKIMILKILLKIARRKNDELEEALKRRRAS